MPKFAYAKKINVCLDSALEKRLRAKMDEGYSMSGLVRRALVHYFNTVLDKKPGV